MTLTGPEIALPPALAAILSRLPMHGQHPRPGPLIVGEAPGWLFPGSSATGHLNSSVLSGGPTRLIGHVHHMQPIG